MNNPRQQTTGTRQQLFSIWNFVFVSESGFRISHFPWKGSKGINDVRLGIN
jgi:hypothetical protein